MPTIRTATTAALAALTLSLAACGGGGGGSALSKGDLVSKANGICKSNSDAFDKIKKPTNIQDATQAAAYFDDVAPLAEKQQKALEALKPKSDVKSDWDAFIAASRKATDQLTLVQKKADAKDASGLKDLAAVEPLAAKATSTAKTLGLTSCQ